ncbi:hypothetical protein PT974_04834 [Cladobotryum mycophilum]|uniref:Uncharacterized protein n=1 Tax=Cladobotryum mycophilum TaxID=491253 RepID=A0ABR0SQA2_9HYPO
METSADDDAYLSSAEASDDDSEVTLSSISKTHTITFPLKSTYTNWGSVEAFREFVQNWRDAIIASFRLDEHNFRVIREEHQEHDSVEVVYKVPRPHSDPLEYLGYIHFDERSGSVEIVNRNAQLKPSHLDLGSTSKSQSLDQAGAHGEGLKIALLVMQRESQNHAVHCVHGSCTWNFNFTGAGRLVAHIRRMSAKHIEQEDSKSQKVLQRGLVPFAPSSVRDVRFIISGQGQGRDERGLKKNRSPVGLGEFREWCESALFLQNLHNDGIISSARGDLITDPSLRGNLYLKGLLLSKSTRKVSASLTGKNLRFGYNFYQGQTNRERQSFTKTEEEGYAIINIWDAVISFRPEYVAHLSDMLLLSKPECADVAVATATECMSKRAATVLRDHLFSDGSKWYYSVDEKKENPRLKHAIQSLDREGCELPNPYWNILANHGLVITVKKEQERRFFHAEVVAVPDNSFAQGMFRLLQACLNICQQKYTFAIQFVQAGQLPIHVCYIGRGRVLRIHAGWLGREQSAEGISLSSDFSEAEVLVLTTQRLFAEVLDEIPSYLFRPSDKHSDIWHKRRVESLVEQRLLRYIQMQPRFSLEASTTGSAVVCWDQKSSSCLIQIHREATCSGLRQKISAKDFFEPDDCDIDRIKYFDQAKKCFQFTADGVGVKTLYKLNAETEYFAVMLKTSDPDSIAIISNVYKTSCQLIHPVPVDDLSDSESEASVTYTLGAPLATLDMLAPRDWYEAINKNSEEAVVGVPWQQAQTIGPEETPDKKPPGRPAKKRRRRGW